jgi:hypothetical protein
MPSLFEAFATAGGSSRRAGELQMRLRGGKRSLAGMPGLIPDAGAGWETALLLPVPAAEPAVSRHRARFDVAARDGVPAHVTVLYPFLPPAGISEPLQAASDRICSAWSRGSMFVTASPLRSRAVGSGRSCRRRSGRGFPGDLLAGVEDGLAGCVADEPQRAADHAAGAAVQVVLGLADAGGQVVADVRELLPLAWLEA